MGAALGAGVLLGAALAGALDAARTNPASCTWVAPSRPNAFGLVGAAVADGLAPDGVADALADGVADGLTAPTDADGVTVGVTVGDATTAPVIEGLFDS